MQNEDLKVGLLKEYGGAIGFIQPTGLDYNLVNNEDSGRLIQQSYYGDFDGSKWGSRDWRYNPVQGGDHKYVGSEILDFNIDGTKSYVRTVPRHWATGQLLSECMMEQLIELNGPVMKVRYKFHYWGEKLHHPHHQENPAFFLTKELDTLVTYAGDKPWTDGPLESFKPGWPNEYTPITEHWVAYVGKDGMGLGVFTPGVDLATYYRFPGKGVFKIKKTLMLHP